MATKRRLDTGSGECSDVKCCICAKKKKVTKAEYYCYDCDKHMCTSCLGPHNEFDENHYVVPGIVDRKDMPTDECGKHAGEIITFYCHKHNELLCKKCRLEHRKFRKCQHAQNIRESSDELNADPELQAVPAQLKAALDIINEYIEVLDIHMASIQKNGDVFLKDLEDYAKKLLSRIEELRQKGKENINSKQDALISVAKQHRRKWELTKDEINKCLDNMTKYKERKAYMFVLRKKGQIIPHKVGDLQNEFKSLIKEHHFFFTANIKIIEFLSGFSSLVTTARTIDVSVEGDTSDCQIRGLCHFSDGSLVIADYMNKRLKGVDPSKCTVTKHRNIDEKPTDVCCIGPQEFAVAFGSTQVHVYNVVSLTRKRTIELRHETNKIACHGGLLYCAGRVNILYVHDVSDGRELRKICLKDTVYGRDQFCGNIFDIALNGSGDRVYVTDYWGIVCVNTDEQLIKHIFLKDLGLLRPSGVTTDHRGHMFVCGCYPNNVVKLTDDGHVVGQILSRENAFEWSPECLSYDVSRSQLYVGGNSNKLLMDKLK